VQEQRGDEEADVHSEAQGEDVEEEKLLAFRYGVRRVEAEAESRRLGALGEAGYLEGFQYPSVVGNVSSPSVHQ